MRHTGAMSTPIRRTPENEKQLGKILAAKVFQRAKQQAAMLRFVAEKTMDESSEDLDQGLIAKAVFPESDAGVVGTTAFRIRRSLRGYYAEEGRNDPIIFQMPEGSYYITAEPGVASLDWSALSALEDKHNITIREFREFLESLCELEGMKAGTRNESLKKWVQHSVPFSKELPKLRTGTEFHDFFDRLRESGEKLKFLEMRDLTKSLGIHAIMLDPLLSEPVQRECVVLQFPIEEPRNAPNPRSTLCVKSEFVRVGQPGEGSHGERVQYLIPAKRKAGADASFVHLVLQPTGHSDVHHHPGDELMLVLKGSVQVRLEDSGVQFELGMGSMTHFYAEQTHSAHNVSTGEAHLFIIRFYQRGVPGTRQEMRRGLWGALDKWSESAIRLQDVPWGWILEAAAGRSVRRLSREPAAQEGIPQELLNRLGLARLLKRLPAPPVGRARAFLRKAKGKDQKPCDSLQEWLWRLETNREIVATTLVPEICELFGVFDLLIWEFVFPGVTRQVVVARREADDEADDWIDLARVAGGQPATGVTYEIPKRSLACSDITIAWLTLEPGKVTRENDHPGLELPLPVKGEATIEYAGEKEPVCTVSALQHCAHYNSERQHRVCNYSSSPAEMIVIRFYGENRKQDGGLERTGKPRMRGSSRQE